MTEDPAEVHAYKHLANFVLAEPGLEPGKVYLLEVIVIPQGGTAVFLRSYRFTPLKLVKVEP